MHTHWWILFWGKSIRNQTCRLPRYQVRRQSLDGHTTRARCGGISEKDSRISRAAQETQMSSSQNLPGSRACKFMNTGITPVNGVHNLVEDSASKKEEITSIPPTIESVVQFDAGAHPLEDTLSSIADMEKQLQQLERELSTCSQNVVPWRQKNSFSENQYANFGMEELKHEGQQVSVLRLHRSKNQTATKNPADGLISYQHGMEIDAKLEGNYKANDYCERYKPFQGDDGLNGPLPQRDVGEVSEHAVDLLDEDHVRFQNEGDADPSSQRTCLLLDHNSAPREIGKLYRGPQLLFDCDSIRERGAFKVDVRDREHRVHVESPPGICASGTHIPKTTQTGKFALGPGESRTRTASTKGAQDKPEGSTVLNCCKEEYLEVLGQSRILNVAQQREKFGSSVSERPHSAPCQCVSQRGGQGVGAADAGGIPQIPRRFSDGHHYRTHSEPSSNRSLFLPNPVAILSRLQKANGDSPGPLQELCKRLNPVRASWEKYYNSVAGGSGSTSTVTTVPPVLSCPRQVSCPDECKARTMKPPQPMARSGNFLVTSAPAPSLSWKGLKTNSIGGVVKAKQNSRRFDVASSYDCGSDEIFRVNAQENRPWCKIPWKLKWMSPRRCRKLRMSQRLVPIRH